MGGEELEARGQVLILNPEKDALLQKLQRKIKFFFGAVNIKLERNPVRKTDVTFVFTADEVSSISATARALREILENCDSFSILPRTDEKLLVLLHIRDVFVEVR